MGSNPGLRRSPGIGNGNLLQYSCLGISMDGGNWCSSDLSDNKKISMANTDHLNKEIQLSRQKGWLEGLIGPKACGTSLECKVGGYWKG